MSTVKQILVIRRDLKCRRGKEIAQGSHASMAFILSRLLSVQAADGMRDTFLIKLSPAEIEWIQGNYRKVVCQLDTAEQLLDLYELARLSDIQAHLVYDEGATEFHGARTLTALAIGPDYSDRIDPITSGLVLY